MAPIGTILAWHKSFTNTPSLPDGWVECDGSTISDSESVYNGQAVPDLNSDIGGSGGRFLRGATTSGTTQGNAIQGHYHSLAKASNVHEWYFPGGGGHSMPGGADDAHSLGTTGTRYSIGNPTTGSNGAVSVQNETRPENMSVVFIIRIK